MTIQIELWALLTFLVGLLLSFLGAVFGGGKILLAQVEKRLDERFQAQERSRVESQRHLDAQLKAIEAARRDESIQWQRVERELLTLKAELPRDFVMRDDYVRNQTVIEAKLDALALRWENAQLRGAQP